MMEIIPAYAVFCSFRLSGETIKAEGKETKDDEDYLKIPIFGR